MTKIIDKPIIPCRLQRPLAAAWVSLGLHVAVIALVQVALPGETTLGGSEIEVRLVSSHAYAPTVATESDVLGGALKGTTLLSPGEVAEALPGSRSMAPPPIKTLSTADSESQPASADRVPVAKAPSVADLTYYSAHEVDVTPSSSQDYQAEIARLGLSGKVSLKLKIEADGRVSEVEIVSPPLSATLSKSVIKLFRGIRFEPAIKSGRPVRALIMIELWDEGQG